MRSDLEKLIDLQVTDTNIRRLKQKIETADLKRAEIEREFEQHAFSIREVQKRGETLTQERTALERQIEETKVYKERAERNLKHAQNQKEYETAMRELDALQKQIAGFETQVVEKMAASEETDKELSDRSEEIETLDAKRAEAFGEFDKEVGEARRDFESETAKREEVFKTLAPQLASVYNRMAQRSRDGIAVAEVVNGSCSACFMSLRPQRLMEVKRMDSIITCESCTRILYVVPAGSKAAAEG